MDFPLLINVSINPKFEAPNPKQIQNSNIKCSKSLSHFEFGILVIEICFGFRILNFDIEL